MHRIALCVAPCREPIWQSSHESFSTVLGIRVKTMSRKRATSYDVARLAGVSQSAVSRVFSPNGSASSKTRKKVLAAADELGFAPNPIAKSLSLGRSRMAGLVVTQYTQQNYPIPLKSALDVISKSGDSLLTQIVDASDDGDDAVRQLLLKRVDFILCAASLSWNATMECRDANVPLVMINRRAECPGVDTIGSPNAGIMKEVAELLYDRGARAPVFLGGGVRNWVSVERCRGLVEASAQVGLAPPVVLDADFNYDGGRAAMRSLAPCIGTFDAVVTASDAMAIGAIDVLRQELALKVPEDVQVVGHDDVEAGRFQAYRLTTVRQDMHTIFSRAIELAFSKARDFGRKEESIIVQNKLIERATTTSPADSSNNRTR
ncbi:MAG: LacI family DNA-binding transcriptional regulator [Pseudomonadota bacterium]